MTARHVRPVALAAALAFTAACLVAAAIGLARPRRPPLTVTVVAFNDLHGHLDGADLRWDGAPAGGIAFLAAHAQALARDQRHRVLVSVGDNVGASPLASGLFHDEPTIEALNALGLAASATGNHEFDEGLGELLRLQGGGCHPAEAAHTCRGASAATAGHFEGARFAYLAANVTDTGTGRRPLQGYVIREYEGVAVAFVGIVAATTPSMVVPSAVAGLRFGDEAEAVDRLVPELREQGVEAIVLLLHEGGATRGGGIGECRDFSGAAAEIVARLDDEVDAVLTGHTHGAYDCRLRSRAGRAIPVTGAGSYGRLLTTLRLTLDRRTRDVVAAETRNHVVTREGVRPDPGLTRIVERYRDLARPIVARAVGSVAADLRTSRDPRREAPLGDAIADAQLAATRGAGAVVAFMNADGVRADLLHAPASDEGPGVVTYGEAFAVQPFGNPLVTLTLGGRELLALLEQQWGATQPYLRQLRVSQGLSYTHDFDFDAPFAAERGRPHVCPGSVRIDGRPLDLDAAYRVTVNGFLAEGGGDFGLLREGRERVVGASDLAALEAWLAARSPLAPPAPGRVRRVGRCG